MPDSLSSRAAELVCLHGFTGSPRNFEALEFPDIVCWTPWLLGHGPQAATGPQSWPACFDGEVARLEAERQRRPLAQRWLIGYSLGARVALRWLCHAPGAFAGAVLFGVHPGLESEAERHTRRLADQQWIDLLRTDGVETFVERWEERVMFETQKQLSADRLQQQRTIRRSHSADGLQRALEVLGLGAMPPLPRPAPIDCPVTLVVGALDSKFRALAEDLAQHLPRAQLRLVPDCGHNVLLEAPGAAASLIAEAILGARR